MKILSLKNLLYFSFMLSASVLVTSCDDDDDPLAVPEAGFSYVVEGKTVTFTNESIGEEMTYSWDMGDGATSTDENPTYTFAANGSYVLTLTATNESGSDVATEAAEIINITIGDGFSDWDDSEIDGISYSDGEGGSVVEMKVENLGTSKLYIYLKATSLTGYVNMYLNLDNSTETGAASWLYPAGDGMGADFLVQGDLFNADVLDSEIFMDNPDDDGWCWTADCTALEPVPVLGLGSEVFDVAVATSDGFTEVEFSIDLSKFATVAGAVSVSEDAIGIAFNDVNNTTWANEGAIPEAATETSALFMKSL